MGGIRKRASREYLGPHREVCAKADPVRSGTRPGDQNH